MNKSSTKTHGSLQRDNDETILPTRNKKENELSMHNLRTEAIAGFVSGTVTRVVVAPFDVVKIRMQIQVRQLPSPESSSWTNELFKREKIKYEGVIQSLRYIRSREGYKGLFRGTLPGVSLWATYMCLQFPTYQVAHQLSSNITDNSFVSTFCGGAIAAFVAQSITYPLDTIRTRYVSLDERTAEKGYVHLVSSLIRTEGILGLYAGIRPTLLQVVPGMALTFMFYENIKIDFGLEKPKHPGRKNNGDISSLVRGAIAGFLSKLVIYPLDTFKKRLQLAGTIISVPNYSGITHCASSMMKEEGVMSFYRGLSATLAKSTISTACSFYVYESVNTYLSTNEAE